MSDATLTVARLHAELSLLGPPAVVAPARGRFDRALARLPSELASAAAPLLESRDGVVRLRRLQVAVDSAGALDEAQLARLVAERLVAVLREALERPDGEVRVWVTHTDYLASYVETRLGLEAGPDWPFAELRALAVLPPGEAAVEVLRARPEVLAALATRGAAAFDPARLVGRLLDHDVVALVAGIADDARTRPVAAADTARLAAHGDLVQAGATAGSAAGRARAVLAMLLRTAADGAPDEPPVQAALAVVALGIVTHARAAQGLGRLAPQHLAPGLGAATVAPLPARFAAALEAALDAARTDTALHAALASTLPHVVDPPRDPVGGDDSGRQTTGRPRPAAPRTVVSPVAGLALLLPGVARHDLVRALPPPGLRAAVLSALAEQAQRGAATDPLVAALLPADPHAAVDDAAVPPVPVGALATLSPEVRGLVPGRAGVAGWGDLLLATFADRLPGLRGSSRGWLQRQFLHVPGRLDVADDLLHVTLEGPPLAVVLGMAGFDGPQGRLPHLDGRRLLVTLTGLRR